MRRKAVTSGPAKTKLSVTPATTLVEWVDSRVGPGRPFATMTHAVEVGLTLLREHEEGVWIRKT